MIGKYKIFEENEYNECNDQAIDTVTSFLKSRGLVLCKKDEEDYKVDITCTDKSGLHTYYHEVEVKKVWDGSWPDKWKTVQIPERKGKFAKSDHYIWLLRKDLKRAWLVPGDHLTKDKLEMVRNKKIRYGEYFYAIPIGECLYVDFETRKGRARPKGTLYFAPIWDKQ